MRKEDVTNFRI